MNKNKDIQRLIDLFMAGQTSIEEEQRLSEYFRTNAVPEEWQAYKEMFGYFDEGMPMGRYDGESGKKTNRQRIGYAIIAAAAAIVLLFVMTWKSEKPTAIQPEQQPQTAVIAPDSLYNSAADTTSTDDKKPSTNTRKRKQSKHKYRLAPPKTYYAQSSASPSKAAIDSISYNERLIAAQLKSAEIADKLLLRKLELMETARELEIILAANEDVFDDEDAEIVY